MLSYRCLTTGTGESCDLSRYFEDEEHFVAAVTRGAEAMKAGEYLTHEQVGQRLGGLLKG